MVAVTELVTTDVFTLNGAEVEPAGTVTEVGTVALELLDDKLTTTPPDPAGPLSVTVPADAVPPATDDGATDTLINPVGFIVRVVVCVDPPEVPVIVAVVVDVTAAVVTLKVAVLRPAGTSTVDGTVAEAEFELKLTVMPPDGEMPLRVTVPVEFDPPKTVLGETVTLDSVAGVIVRVAVLVAPLKVPVIVADV